ARQPGRGAGRRARLGRGGGPGRPGGRRRALPPSEPGAGADPAGRRSRLPGRPRDHRAPRPRAARAGGGEGDRVRALAPRRRAGGRAGAGGLRGLPGGRAARGGGVDRPAHGRPSDGDGADRRARSRCARPGGRRPRATARRVGHSGRRSMSSSRIAAFYRLTVKERRQKLAEALDLSPAEIQALEAADALPLEVADIMVENAVATFALPFGVALNFQVNGRDHVIPMVVEEPSVIAAASNAALVARAGGGFAAEADPGAMIGQIQLVDVPDPGTAVERLGAARARILAAAEELTPGLCRRGAGPRDVEVRLVRSARGETMVVVHLLLDTGDAMGANAVNSLVEALAPMVEEIAGGTTCLRILSNLADRRLARAAVRIPFAALARDGMDGAQVAERILWAYELAAADP